MSHFVIYVPSLRGGGAERIMVMVANGLAALGHRVDLVLTKAEGPYMAEVGPQVRLVNLNNSRVLASLIPLAQWLRRERPDAMLAALNHANLIAIMARSLARSKARLVISERNSLVSLGKGRQGRLMRRLMRWLYPKADGVIALTRAGIVELTEGLGLDPEKVVAIPNPVDALQIKALAARRPDHPWLCPGQPPVILAVGRLEKQKDYPTLLRAFALLRAGRPARLVILGEGRERVEIERQIEALDLADDVFLAGFKSNPFGWMAAAAVYVLSSRHEGSPNALLQAMACGAPVVSTDCPTGPAELLEEGKWGQLVPVGDAGALARAIQTTLDEGEKIDCSLRMLSFRPDIVVNAYEEALR